MSKPKYRIKAGVLNPPEKKMIEAYTKPNAPTTLNATKSYQEAYGSSYAVAASNAHVVMKRPIVKKSIQELIEDRSLHTKVVNNMERLVAAAESAAPDDWKMQKLALEASTFLKDVSGWKKPDQHLHVSLTPEQRDEHYLKIVELVRKTEQEQETGSSATPPV